MALSQRSKRVAVALVGSCLFVAGCTNPEYTNNWDAVSAKAGNATYGNTAIHETTPFPPYAYDTTTSVGP